jgi:predicted RecA/RadA family phage recombinase
MSRQAVYVQNGNVIDVIASADISVGDVVPLTNMCGVALVDIAANDTGSVKLDGVFTLPTDTGAAWSVGEKVYWDATNKKATKTATSNTPLGFAVTAKVSAGTSCNVKLQGF